jgi:hypothetical protein
MTENTKLKKLLKQRIKPKSVLVLFSMALGVIVIGYIILSTQYTSKSKKGTLISAEDIGTNELTHTDKNTSNLLTSDYMDETKPENGELGVLNKAVENEIPFLIETIGVNEAVCIGKIDIKDGSVYTINASSESGEKIFVALNESDNISKYKGIIWHQFTEKSENQIQAQFADMQTGTFYVYVGNTGQEPLVNVLVNGIPN